MMQLNCQHAGTCLPDYWCGHHLPHISVPVWRGMSPAALRAALHSEVSQGAIMGGHDLTRDANGETSEAWDRAAHAAINRDVKPAKKGARRLFLDLEPEPENSDACESVQAFFVFTEKETQA